MKVRIIAAMLAALVAAPVWAGQGDDDVVRSGFLISRRKAAAKPATAKKRAKKIVLVARLSNEALGLGYTVFRRGPSGQVLRTGASEQLRDGDQIRVVVEPNEDGYLYVFNSDDRGNPPVMIFPDPRLNAGGNRVRAHVPYEFPSSRERDESLRWLHLDGGPIVDRLHVLVTREPLPDVPTGAALARACGGADAERLWEPSNEVWASLGSAPMAPKLSRADYLAGLRQSDVERAAVERSVRLGPAAPAPSVVVMNDSPETSTVSTVVTIEHR